MGSELPAYSSASLRRMVEGFGKRLEVSTVSELSERGVIFVEDGNHGENRPRQDEFASTGIAFLRPPDLVDGRVDFQNCGRINEAGFRRVRKGIGRRGDIILTHRATVGRIAITDHNAPEIFVTNPGTTIWRSTNSEILDQRYLYCYMRSSAFMEQLWSQVGNNCTFDYVSLTQQRGLRVAFPPIAEQKAIASALGALDDKIELNRRMNATLEAMARALFESWFVFFDPVRAKIEGHQPPGMDKATAALFPDSFQDSDIGHIPKGWAKTTIGREADFFTGFAFQSEQFSSAPHSIRLARGDNVKEGFFHWDSKTRYWPKVSPELERYQLRCGDVLIGMDGSKVGKNWVRVRNSDLPCLLVQRVARLRAAQSVGEHFLWLLLSDSRFRFHVEAVKTGTSIPHISGGQIKAYDFVRPPLGDNRLFRRFEELVRPLGEQMDANIGQSRTLATLRDTLLPRLLSGELGVPVAARI